MRVGAIASARAGDGGGSSGDDGASADGGAASGGGCARADAGGSWDGGGVPAGAAACASAGGENGGGWACATPAGAGGVDCSAAARLDMAAASARHVTDKRRLALAPVIPWRRLLLPDRLAMLPTDTATGKNPQLFSFPDGCGVHASVRGLSSWAALVAVLFAGAGCGRTQLEPFQPKPMVDAATAMDLGGDVGDAAQDTPPDLPADLPPDMAMDVPVERAMDAMSVPEAPPACQPQPETCNGADDDCDGAIDEDLPAIPCPDGGNRYCVGGRYSDCPRRCDICVPGSKRTCITSFCTFWGSQTCSADGRSFGRCVETRPPPECEAVANKMMRSPALEQCCVENGYCCVDEFDLDRDGDRTEMMGRCDAVVCDQ